VTGILRAQLFRENKGWVLVVPATWTDVEVMLVKDYWAKVSDLPIIVIMNTDLLIDTEGRVVVKEVGFQLPEKPVRKPRKKKEVPVASEA
jgi:hypothetical protein